MSKRKKIVKFRRRKDLNIGILIFVILFIYIAVNVYIYFTKEHVSIYEVKVGKNTEDTRINGIVLRDEAVQNSSSAGYVTYYVNDGGRVAKNASIYSIDDSRKVYDYMLSQDNPIKLTKKNSSELKQTLNSFYKVYSDKDFSSSFEYEEIIENKLSEVISNAILEESVSISEETGLFSNIKMVNSTASGIITYSCDGLENLTEEGVNASLFEDTASVTKQNLRTSEMVSMNTPVFKQIYSDDWTIILPLTPEQYAKLYEEKNVTFIITKDNLEVTAPISFYQSGAQNFAKISMDKYVRNYMNDRFLEIDIELHEVEGLKIPLTSIVEKEFYLVPLDYFTTGGDNDKKGLVMATYNEQGEISYSFVETETYYETEEFGYVDASMFSLNTKFRSTTNETYSLTQMASLTGVYNINKGYAVFRRIEVLYENNEYCIIKKDTENGLSNYDHIALDSKTIEEDAVIY